MNELLKYRNVVAVGFFCLFATALLTGCSKEDDPDLLPNGKQPITLTATVEGQTVTRTSTRATGNGSWEGGEEVAMQIDGTVKKYTAATSGVLSAASGVTPWYWQNTSDTKSIEAWHPYNSGTKPTAFTVTADQSVAGYQQSDLIYTPATAISYVSPKLTFRHLPVRVVVNLQEGDGVTEAEVQSATVTLVNQALTSGTIATDWSVAQVASGNSTIVPNPLATPSPGSHKTVQALVVPQLTTTAARFIRITIGGQEFIYSTALNLVAGTQYTYTITVSRNGINVTASGGQAWTGSDTPVTSKEVIAGYAPSDLKIGDYYYSDGTSSDGGYREYTDGSKATLPIMPVLTDASGNARTVVGIVYWVGDPTNTTNGDPLLKRDQPGCTHGLAVALHEAKQPLAPTAAQMKWSNSSGQVNNWTNHGDRGADKVNITEENKMQGYANTVALKAYNAQQNNADLKVLPIAAIEQYQADYPAPANSSGWYLPSIMELKYVCWGQGNVQSAAGRDLLNGQFAKAGGTPFDTSWPYWSSSELAGNSLNAWDVLFSIGLVNRHYKDFNAFWVRALFAF